MSGKSTPRARPLALGEPAPDFGRSDHAGRPVRLSALRGRWVVLFFYPKDGTPACTAQVCAFRDAYDDLLAAGAVVIGVSGDSDDSHRAVAARRDVPYHLISDHDGSLRALLSVPRFLLGLFPGRVTYVIDPQGVVRQITSSPLNVKRHVARALDAIRAAAPS